MKKLHFTKRKRKLKIFTKRAVLSSLALLIISIGVNFVPTTVKAQTYDVTSYKSVLISEGDTLWDIAKEYNNSPISTSKYIEQIKEVNNLNGDYIINGNYLLVPVYEE